jgi:hypothetical protein
MRARIILAFSAALLLAGCGVSIDAPTQSVANTAANSMTYSQDPRTGLCFGVVSSKSATHVNDQSLTITWVPCDEKVLALIAK